MQVRIEKLVYGGDGLARSPEEGDTSARRKTVFIPFVLPGEEVEAEVMEEHPGFARAQLTGIISPSDKRISAECPYFQRCGGCHYQHTSYEHQLVIKKGILRETLRRVGKLDWTGEIHTHASPPWSYRSRARMRVIREPEFSLAYFRLASHAALAIDRCPIASPLINRAISAVNVLGRAGGVPEGIGEMEFFADAEDAQFMLELYCDSVPHEGKMQKFSADLTRELPECVAIAAFKFVRSRMQQGQVDDIAPRLVGRSSLIYRAGGDEYRVSPGAFFQTNRYLVETLIGLVTQNRFGPLGLDLYAGVGLFTVPLARNFEHVVAVESAPASVADLRYNCPANVKVHPRAVEQFLAGSEAKGLRPEFIVADPPRAGLGERIAQKIASLNAPRLSYVSCDPSTLARDLRILYESGYAAEEIHLVDLFPQTFHLETVVQLLRKGKR